MTDSTLLTLEEQLQALARLSGQHREVPLIRSLLEILGLLAPVSGVKYYQLANALGDHEFGRHNVASAWVYDALDPPTMGQPLKSLPSLSEATVSGERRQMRSSGGHSLDVIPVRGSRYIVGLLVLDWREVDPSMHNFVHSLIMLCGNMLTLIFSKEREALTSLYNRQSFEERLHALLDYVGASNEELKVCFALIDIDDFAGVNEKLGHLLGDEVLVHVSQVMNRSFRFYDLLCRFGGGQFVAVMRDTDIDGAACVVERFRTTIEAYHFPQVGKKTVSVGLVQVCAHELMPSILDRARAALSAAHEAGGNQVEVFQPSIRVNIPQAAVGGDVELF
ncbi:MAG: GGDEF domain-containing protein [Gammaproteobacteria bacterium]|nr:GGDEF domain-containing protein [Gammaproteobacteria bacterium]